MRLGSSKTLRSSASRCCLSDLVVQCCYLGSGRSLRILRYDRDVCCSLLHLPYHAPLASQSNYSCVRRWTLCSVRHTRQHHMPYYERTSHCKFQFQGFFISLPRITTHFQVRPSSESHTSEKESCGLRARESSSTSLLIAPVRSNLFNWVSRRTSIFSPV